jgi:PAS domain S-box-containing protein
MTWLRSAALRRAVGRLVGHPPGPDSAEALELGLGVIDSVDEPVVLVDPRLMIVGWNTALARLTGRKSEDAVGVPAEQALRPLAGLGLIVHLRRALEGETTRTIDAPYVGADGTGGWMAARCAPVCNAPGAIVGAVAFFTEVTERRRRAAWVRAIETIGRSLTSSLDLDEVLDTIVEKALEVMAAEGALVVSWNPEARELRVLRAAGRLTSRYAGGTIPATGGPMSRCVQEGRLITTSNILDDPLFWIGPERRSQIESEGFRAVASAPLASKGRVHGALCVHYWTERTFTDEERTALTVLAEQAALAIDSARLYADARRQAERLRELADVERLVMESLDLDDVLQRIAEATARLLGAQVVQVWTADPGARRLRRRAQSIAAGVPEFVMQDTLGFGEGLSGAAAETRTAIFVPDVQHEPRVHFRRWADQSGLGTMLAVPVVSGDTLLGVLTVRARTGSIAVDEDQALVTSLAARAAVAINNARVYAQAVERARRLQSLAAVSQSITSSLALDEVFGRITRATAEMSPGALAAVHVYDANRNVLSFAGVSGPQLGGLPVERPATDGLPGLVFERRLPVLIPEPVNHPRTLAVEWWEQRPSFSYYGVPIVVGDTFVGILDYISEGLPDQEVQEALQLLAAQAGVAIRNASLYQAESEQSERTRALAAINQRISGELELDELLREISASAAQLTGARFVAFWLADDRRRRVTFAGGSVPEIADDLPEREFDYDTGGVGWVARERAPLVVRDIFADDRMINLDWARRWNLGFFVAVPVLGGNELLAVVALSHSEPIRLVTETREVIEAFVAQAAIAIQNAQLYREAHRRREVAEAQALVGRELTGTLDVDHIAQVVTRRITELLEVRRSAMFHYEPADGTLHIVASYGDDAAAVARLVLQRGEGVAGPAAEERRLVASTDILNEPSLWLSAPLRERFTASGNAAAMAVPLIARERVVGAITVGAETGREFSEDDRQTLQAFADQSALALDNARLYETARDSLARLRDTQHQLVEAAKLSALGQLVSGVAHELNNPLSVIIGYGQLLLQRDLPPGLQQPLELMVAQGDRMAKIVQNLLLFARQRPHERAGVDLHVVVEQAIALRQSQLTVSDIQVAREFAAGLPLVIGDAQQLQQVFLNLLLNAEQAIVGARRNGGRITFRTRVLEGGARVLVQVEDDGPGIPPAVLSRIFEPFFTTKGVGAGTGLGLSVSYGIVEQHGGSFDVESAPGRTVFTLEFPAQVTASTGAAVPGRAPALGAGRPALLVEDEPAVRELLRTLLTDTGWRVDVASGGRSALERVREKRYDLIVSDIRMPDGSGDDFYRAAVAHDAALADRFVFITGDTANPEALRFLEQARRPVLAKPFPPSLFLEAVRAVASSLTSSGPSA